ncbi:MAG TPA: thioredoxin domain-containing protein, partial [Chthoniobacterales bacterium]
VLVEFATGWSFPSLMLDGALDEIAAEFADCLKVAYVKLDCNPNLGLWYGIRSLPTMLYFVDGEVRIGIFGTTSKEAILAQLNPATRLLPCNGARIADSGIEMAGEKLDLIPVH